MKTISVNGKEYYTQEDKDKILEGKGFIAMDIVIYFKKTKKKLKLYDKTAVDNLYLKSNRRKNVYFPKYARPKTLQILKDYSIFRMRTEDIIKKHNISRQRLHQILDYYADPAKDKYELAIKD